MPPAASPEVQVLRINIPVLKLQKAIRVNSSDLVWTVKRQVEEKVAAEIKDVLNYGLFVHGKDGKKGKYLDERNTVGSYHLDQGSQIDFQIKTKVGGEVPDAKKQKKFIEDIQKGNLDKIKERTQKNTDFNFLIDGDTPISVAVMNNDAQMIIWLMDNGAFLDYRVGDKDQWKTPMHLAALNNKSMALKTLIQFGAWVDSQDTLGLTPLFYAASSGNTECVLRLLLAKADTEIFDKHGRTPLHQASLNNYDCIVALLLDFGANIHATNVGGNTPLHVAASRNSKESTKWLLLRGADTEKVNKSGKKPFDMAMQAACNEVCEVLSKFRPEQSIIPPPRYIPESSSEYDPIVQNVLSALSSSIGKEYTPNVFYIKPPTASMRIKSTTPLRKTISSVTAADLEDKRMSVKLPPPPTNRISTGGSPVAPDLLTAATIAPTEMSTPEKSSPPSIDDPSNRPNSQLSNPPENTLIAAWRKIDADPKNATVLINLKNYLTERIISIPANDNSGKLLDDLLSGLEDLESGVCRAANELDRLRKENDNLSLKLKGV